MRARASASIAGLWSMPTARSAQGRERVRASARCRCRDRAARGTACRRSVAGSPPRPVPRGRAGRGCVSQSAARCGEIGGGLPAARLARHVEPRAVGGAASGRRGRGARPDRAPARRRSSASRKKAQAPSRWRSARPASTSSLRWRETRGCDWPRMATSLADRQFGLAEQAEEAQPRDFARRLEAGEQGVEAHRRRRRAARFNQT